MKNLGTKIERIAKPIAKSIDAIWGSDLAGCSGCSKMRDNLNAGMSVQDAIIERWFSKKLKGEKMQFQILIIVEADGVPQAVTPDVIAKGTIISVNPRPQAPKPGVQTGIQTSGQGQFSKTVVQPT